MKKGSSNLYNEPEMSDPLEPLSQLQRMEAPPFLLTRIREQQQEKNNEALRPGMAWALGFSFLLVMTLNVLVIANRTNERKAEKLMQAFQLMPQNELYR